MNLINIFCRHITIINELYCIRAIKMMILNSFMFFHGAVFYTASRAEKVEGDCIHPITSEC